VGIAGGAASPNVAVIDFVEFTVTLQFPVPVQPPPLQPAKDEASPGVAERATSVPNAYVSEQSPPQLIPATSLVTVPVPEPVLSTETVKDPVKVALTDFAESIVTEHAPEPEHAPLHPEKADPAAGAAVRLTTLAPEKFHEH
jgi:hypothetical protein